MYMNTPIYFTKIEFQELIGENTRVIFLNTVEQELSYQIFHRVRQSPAIQKVVINEFLGKSTQFDICTPAKIIKNYKNGFKPQIVEDDIFRQEVIFSYGIRLSNKQMNEILKYCNALEFEPYRGKSMSMEDKGYIGYRDLLSTNFKGITDSYLPLLELSMPYYYDEQHIWPCEKLYRFLLKNYFENNKKLKNTWPSYGSLSIFF